MSTWRLSIRPSADSGLPAVDTEIESRDTATVGDLAAALGAHLAPDRVGLLVVPVEARQPWPADRLLDECGIRTGDVVDVVTVPPSWRTRPGPPGRVRAVLDVVAGPDTGRRLLVRSDRVAIGRAGSCTLRLTDRAVSQRHASISFAGVPAITDDGSANGTRVGDEPITRSTHLDWGARIGVGDSTVVLQPAEGTSTGASTTDVGRRAGDVGVFRTPRFGEPLAEAVIDLPAPPDQHRPSPLPWTMVLMPMVLGLALLTRGPNAYALIYMLAWPFIGLGGWYQQRRSARKEFAKQVAEWREEVEALLTGVDEAAEAQRTRAEDDQPDVDVVVRRITDADRRLWSRARDDDDFLSVRSGRGPVPARMTAKLADGGDRPTRLQMKDLVDERAVLDGLPVDLTLADTALLAIAGPPARTDATARALLLRLCADHSPADLRITAALGPARTEFEAWLRWLPHASATSGEPPVAVGGTAAQRLLDRLVAEPGTGHTVCIVDEDCGVARRTVEAAAAAAEPARLHLVWLAADPDTVPAATVDLIDLTASEVARSRRGGVRALTSIDELDIGAAWRAARAMTSYTDEAAVLPPETALPDVIRLPELSGDLTDPDDVGAVLHRWRARSGLRAQIGAGPDGVVTVDLRADGPHALVAGTTGSGKSELLQSLICSLALNNPPSRISFLLVDYKGGAAFSECADLPHTVGYITDLTPALVTRALTSLGAEINRREELLGRYGVKDLIQLERERPDVAPPSLFICVDEFAALSAEVPTFVDGMVNIAQRGRSLGMHLLLATQRPAGVVTANIRANTDLRIALRVGSVDDSTDVLDHPGAARISRRTPGRAWIRRTGQGTPELVQAAWVGAREVIASERRAVAVRPFSAVATGGTEALGHLNPRTDLERLVDTVRDAFLASGEPAPERPWLPALPETLPLDLDAAAAAPAGLPVLGGLDDPARQSQPVFEIDLRAAGHLLVFGASGSGKSELLRTAAAAVSLGGETTGEPAPYVYGLDFAGGGLTGIEQLPTVAGVINEHADGRVLRLIRVLRRTVTDRAQALAATGSADLDDLARAGHPLARVVVLVDNLAGLLDSLETGGSLRRRHAEMLSAVLQNGRRTGVHVIATVPGRSGVPSSLQAAFGRRLVLRLTNADDYMMLGVPGNVLDSESTPGAGLLGSRPVQIATLGGATGQAETLDRIAERLAPRVAGRPGAPVPAMPREVPDSALPLPEGTTVPIAVDADTVAVVTADLAAGTLLVAGRSGSGRSAVLDGLAGLIGRTDPSTEASAFSEVVRPQSAADLAAWLRGRSAASARWTAVLIDDGHRWDAAAESDASLRADLAEVTTAMTRAADLRLAFVVAADVEEARTKSLTAGVVQTARRGRRGLLLQPDGMDGGVLAVTMPVHTTEPLTGRGRGLWCHDGVAEVVQAVAGKTADRNVPRTVGGQHAAASSE